MVMHARKPQRIGDGYHFEKHQAHPYQVRRERSNKYLNSKYGSSKSYERERMRDRDSPNGNSYRSESPDDRDSPRTDRLYHKTSSYISNKRDRDYKRDKYSDCVKSPKDKRSRLDSDHRTNHDRNSSEKMLLNSVKSQNSSRDTSQRKLSSSCQDKRDGERERDRGERVCRVGDWSEHVSSSGKKYYYNCKTEVSQWEKPREWVLDRCYNNNSSLDNQSRSHTRHPHSSSSSYIHHSSQSSHPNSRTGGSSIADKHSNSRGGPVSKPQQSVSQPSMIPPVQGMVPPPQGMVPPPQGMVPPPQGMVPPPQGMVPPPQGMVPPPQGMVPPPVQVNTVVRPVPAPQTVAPPSSYWATPHMIETSSNDPRKPQDSQPNNNSVDGVGTDMDICSGDSTPTSETNYPGEGCTQSTISSNVHSSVLEGSVNTPGPPVQLTTANLSNNIVVRVSPTNQESESTHENQDCKVGGSLLAGSSLGALRPQGPNLTPSLANHYRDDLVNHVRGWPADIIEKQAQKLSEEAYQLGTMCARVSAELKCPRSLVRQTEIQATRQEQRVLFLRQQIKTLEELKSQNSFMADET